MGVIETIFL